MKKTFTYRMKSSHHRIRGLRSIVSFENNNYRSSGSVCVCVCVCVSFSARDVFLAGVLQVLTQAFSRVNKRLTLTWCVGASYSEQVNECNVNRG